MLSAAYAIIGLKMVDGKIVVAPELFEAKGELQVQALHADGQDWRVDEAPALPPSAEDEAAE